MIKCRKEAEVLYRVKLPDGTILENDTLKPLYYAARRELKSYVYEYAIGSYTFASAVIEYGVLITEYNENFRYPISEFVNSETVCYMFASYAPGSKINFTMEVE